MDLLSRFDQIPALELVDAEIMGKVSTFIILANTRHEDFTVSIKQETSNRWSLLVSFCNGKNQFRILRKIDMIHFHLSRDRDEAIRRYVEELMSEIEYA